MKSQLHRKELSMPSIEIENKLIRFRSYYINRAVENLSISALNRKWGLGGTFNGKRCYQELA
jgi:hypothetical protein